MGTIRRAGARAYLAMARRHGVIPNFWLSEDYLARIGAWELIGEERVSVWEGQNQLFPSLPLDGELGRPLKSENWWADFANFCLSTGPCLDSEFVYAAVCFRAMAGGEWAVFRKNVRKWPRRNPGWEYSPSTRKEVEQTFFRWARDKTPESIEDTKAIEAVLSRPCLAMSIRRGGETVAVNVYDQNWEFINYRYCWTAPEPFLSEFARLLFYTRTAVGRLVNDGGSLGSPTLHEFKLKLRPLWVREVRSNEA